MKPQNLNIIITLQIAILLAVSATAYFTFMNKERIRATQTALVNTQSSLLPTINYIGQLVENKRQEEEASKPLPKGSIAPSFQLEDENKNTVKLENYKGSKTLLVFSQESCPYCQEFYPVLNKFQNQHQDINVVIMQVGSSPDENKAYKKQQGIKPTVLAATDEIMFSYKTMSTPTTILLDEEGKIIDTQAVFRLDELNALVKQS